MHRLRIVHNFLWYLIYAHPWKHSLPHSHLTNQTSENQSNTDTDAKHPANHEHHLPESSKSIASDSVDPQDADTALSNLDMTTYGNEEEPKKDKQETHHSHSHIKGEREVFVETAFWETLMHPFSEAVFCLTSLVYLTCIALLMAAQNYALYLCFF